MLLPKKGNRSGTLSRITLPGQPEAQQWAEGATMSHVFVLDGEKRPLDPIHPGYARWLLSHHKAAVFKRSPFTILLAERKPDVSVQPVRLKIDPGSATTGLALVHDASGKVVWAAELTHRGQRVRRRLADRHAVRPWGGSRCAPPAPLTSPREPEPSRALLPALVRPFTIRMAIVTRNERRLPPLPLQGKGLCRLFFYDMPHKLESA